MPDERAARLARNESRFRQINERVEHDLEPLVDEPDERLPFVCECGRLQCSQTVELSIAEYEAARATGAERRRNRTYQPPGYGGLPVLKTGWGTSPVPLRCVG